MSTVESGMMRLVLGTSCFVQLTDEEVANLRDATSTLSEVVSIEEKFDIVFENFIELEQELTRQVTTYAYRSNRLLPYGLLDLKRTFNRRIINVLTAARTYQDQTKQHVGTIFGAESAEKNQIVSLFSCEYDSALSYRLMEKLRNYAQHQDLPLQGCTLKSRWINSESEERELEFNVELPLVVSDLLSSGFNKGVLAELEQLGERIDLKPMVRQYVEALWRVHSKLREMIASREQLARNSISECIARFLAVCKEPHAEVGLVVGLRFDDGTRRRLFNLTSRQMEYVDYIRAGARSSVKLSKFFVSSSAKR